MSDLSSFLKIKGLGEAEIYLGCHITRISEAKTLTFDRHIYAETVAKRLNVTKTSIVPMATGAKPLSKEDGPKNPKEREEMRRIPYRKAVGALMWAATMTRPDLSFTAHNLAKFCDDPGPVQRVCVCVFFPFILDIKFVGRTSRGHTGGRSHRISHPPSFCGACLIFSREKDSAIPFPRRP